MADDETNISLTMDDFRITSVSNPIRKLGVPALPNPLGLLAELKGEWHGTGFNQIWRPLFSTPASDHFLELNETKEVLQFMEIPGDIPNRGFLQIDIELHGLTYLQKINDANVKQNGKLAGIHIEPGIWIRIPATTNPSDPETVTRMASIPHGTTIVAQGTASSLNGPLPPFPTVDITPFAIGNPAAKVPFPNEQTLSNPSQFRTASGDIPHVVQAWLDNPNVVLANAIAGKKIKSFVVLQIATSPDPSAATPPPPPPTSGGGTSNIGFLQGAAGGPNAQDVQVNATFWIEELDNGKHLLQYSQTVLLNFAPLSWPHVSVATLEKVK